MTAERIRVADLVRVSPDSSCAIAGRSGLVTRVEHGFAWVRVSAVKKHRVPLAELRRVIGGVRA